MNKKLTDFFISSKENTLVLKKQETMVSVSVCDDTEKKKYFYPLYILSFPKIKFSKTNDLVKDCGLINFRGSIMIQHYDTIYG